MQRNVSGQTIIVVLQKADGSALTGAAASLTTVSESLDRGAYVALTTPAVTEVDAMLQPGLYAVALTQAETNGGELAFTGVVDQEDFPGAIMLPTSILTLSSMNFTPVIMGPRITKTVPARVDGHGG